MAVLPVLIHPPRPYCRHRRLACSRVARHQPPDLLRTRDRRRGGRRRARARRWMMNKLLLSGSIAKQSRRR
uniref:Uncharacterized protein n=1 Tax=Oryza nivara TaxID=4536 RepID=A0A0E0J845_ORYNI